MSIQNISKYIYIIISLLVLCGSVPVYAQSTADTTVTDTTERKIKKVDSASHQLTIGIDLVTPLINQFSSGQYGYEFEADYYLRNEFYGVLEGGWGGSTVNYSDLQYKTKNDFLRLGFNKTLLVRDRPKDWDMMFMGLRVAAANVDRGGASYTVVDSLWGNGSGTQPGKSFVAIWAEVTGGMRVELVNGLFAGWNVRGKFIMDGRSFSDLSPQYIAGYGRGDKNTSFDFNVYISYGFRWKRNYKPVKTNNAPKIPDSPAPAKN